MFLLFVVTAKRHCTIGPVGAAMVTHDERKEGARSMPAIQGVAHEAGAELVIHGCVPCHSTSDCWKAIRGSQKRRAQASRSKTMPVMPRSPQKGPWGQRPQSSGNLLSCHQTSFEINDIEANLSSSASTGSFHSTSDCWKGL